MKKNMFLDTFLENMSRKNSWPPSHGGEKNTWPPSKISAPQDVNYGTSLIFEGHFFIIDDSMESCKQS